MKLSNFVNSKNPRLACSPPVSTSALKVSLITLISLAIPVLARAELKSITIPAYQPAFPDAPGRLVFATSCEACHTTRYITQQPKISAAKWEAEVKKMQGTYAAPIADADIPTLVNYLMTAKEGGMQAVWEMPAVPTPNIDVSEVIHPATSAEERTKDLENGRAVFTKNCVSCHGAAGMGDGPSGAALLPKPGNLAAHRYSDEALTKVLKQGIRATAMPSWAALSKDDLRSVITFVQSLSEVDDQPIHPVGPWAKALFAQNCMNCHGADGAANGAASPTLPSPPANFQIKQTEESYAENAVTNGVPGTAMPAWRGKLSEAQRMLLVDYVRSMYRERNVEGAQEQPKE